MKVSGAAQRPTRKEREKLRVARAEKNMPRRSSEKHCRRYVSCVVRARCSWRVKRKEVSGGAARVKRETRMKALPRCF